MLTKTLLVNTLQSFPEEFSLDDLIEKLILLQKIEVGITQVEQGKTVTHFEATQRLQKWLQ